MGKRKGYLIFASVIFLGLFGFTLNTCFADSLRVGDDKVEKYSFSSPAAERNFLEFGQIDKGLPLALTAKTMLSTRR